ncbi:hypothetical protein IHE45_01G037100 [Dioscorea alata]|uniref:Uncharacterized protein n=1 Tax=Dioscorea alata TaxID=55571 RepID=A0ACB7WU38_DIOAL|nr:hypothetical protein IHE45_01G037100 [Dioscorea alata]
MVFISIGVVRHGMHKLNWNCFLGEVKERIWRLNILSITSNLLQLLLQGLMITRFMSLALVIYPMIVVDPFESYLVEAIGKDEVSKQRRKKKKKSNSCQIEKRLLGVME